LLAVSLAHLGANTANDYFDWRSRVDELNTDYVTPYSGGSRMIQLGVISPNGVLRTAVLLYVLAGVSGAYLATTEGLWPPVSALALGGAAIGILYTAPPVRLAARGLGELAVVAAFGPLLVAGAVLVQTGSLEPMALLVGLPTGILTGSIIWINQFPDIKGDAAGGKRTLVVRLGLERSRWVYVGLWLASYTSLVVLVVEGVLPGLALMGLASLPLATHHTRRLFQNYRSRAIKSVMAGTIGLHLATGILIAFGLLLAL
jgi:1,4-dihydroxy-2-naphthoate octaprenyltransferase